MDIKTYLETFKDPKQQDFISKLTPNLPKNYFLGIKNGKLREICKNLSIEERKTILNKTTFSYIEEKMLRRYVIECINDYKTMLFELESFLPLIDSWVTCDAFRNKTIESNKNDFIIHVKKWCLSKETYIARFGIGMLEKYYLDKDYNKEYLQLVSKVDTKDEYYLKMMIAWFFASALAKHYEEAIIFIKNKVLDKWTHNKTIQKAIESYRVAENHKQFLKTLKIK